MDLMDKLTILTNGAKYDAACTSSGADRPGKTLAAGCCHSFAADGRCVTLLKVLLSNSCVHDCKYCVNRATADVERASFTPEELAELTMQFYRRNYIEGLFLSSAVLRSADYTMERMIETLSILRYRYNFWGYIHAKLIPGASPELVRKLGFLADRLSVNIELPSEDSLKLLAPGKTKESILAPMRQTREEITASGEELVRYKHAPRFATAGQATQMIVGATKETDFQILRLSSALYKKYSLKRVFYSAYISVVEDSRLPALCTPPPLLREHRIYQADFLMRQYGFSYDEILSEETPDFNPYLDPKCNWAINNPQFFPVDVNTAPLEVLLRVPGVGPTGAKRIVTARKNGRLGLGELKRIGVVLKRAQYFILCSDNPRGLKLDRETTVRALIDPKIFTFGAEQLSLFDGTAVRALPPAAEFSPAGAIKSVAAGVEEAVLCLAGKL